MPKRTKSKATNATRTAAEAERIRAEATDQARRNYERTLRAGQKMQEDAGTWWTRMFSQAPKLTDYNQPWTAWTNVASQMMPMAQRRMEDAVSFIQQNRRAGVDLIRQAVDAVQTQSLAESQAKWMEFWTSSLKAAQKNVEAVTEISTKTLDSWIDLVRKNSDSKTTPQPQGA